MRASTDFKGIEACSVLNELYGALRPHNNFLQPCMKLETKIRDGSKIVKRYEPARTPYQRVVAHAELDVANADALRASYLRLDPIELLARMRAIQERLFAFCVRAGHRDAVAAVMHVPQHIGTVHDDQPATTYTGILLTVAAVINCAKRSTDGTRKYTKIARWHQARSQCAISATPLSM